MAKKEAMVTYRFIGHPQKRLTFRPDGADRLFSLDAFPSQQEAGQVLLAATFGGRGGRSFQVFVSVISAAQEATEPLQWSAESKYPLVVCFPFFVFFFWELIACIAVFSFVARCGHSFQSGCVAKLIL